MDYLCLFLILLTFLTVLSYWVSTKNYNYWKKQNIPCIPDPIFGIGHVLSVITLKESLISLINTFYNYSGSSVIGFYFLQKPAIVIRDPKLMESVLQTNFSSFSSNFTTLSEKTDPIMAKNPFFTNDFHKWKMSRVRAMNHFTGKKLNDLFIITQHVCSKLIQFINKKIDDNEGVFECELKTLCSKYTGEFVANAAFAIEGESFNDNPDSLAFTHVARSVFKPTIINNIKHALLFYFPTLAEFLGANLLPKTTANCFRNNTIKSIKLRKQTKREAKDYLQFCIDSNLENDIDKIVADLAVLFLDSYETASSALSAVLFYLSENKDVQEIARAHIFSVLNDYNNILTYESLKTMHYLDQVSFEALRLMPPLGVLGKVCTKAITLEGCDGLICHLQPGDFAFIPVWAIHRDPQNWPKPENFDPSRFNLENQTNQKKFTFLPFNKGPRMCPGMRLAFIIIKLALVSLLTKYLIQKSPKTELPIELEPTAIFTIIKGGLWAKFLKLDEKTIST